ncbi:MAG: response regulator [Candidatus Marinimicrobia bacterium]|nr:response regulator [Candidatus Neomarinimicrobiota bacterium]MCF7828205.1 response regulator [Candidatus Neomarinimicrobiota bacterium]MCF7879620.1 response regulator [Candidatus Neomarinimicrobiota bacterium]
MPNATIKICVIDDDDNVRNLISNALTKNGYRVQDFSTGSAGVSYVREHIASIDLVITDLRLPDISGIKVREQLSDIAPELPVIGMSALINEPGLSEKYLEVFQAMMSKPFQFSELLDKVDKTLGLSNPDG